MNLRPNPQGAVIPRPLVPIGLQPVGPMAMGPMYYPQVGPQFGPGGSFFPSPMLVYYQPPMFNPEPVNMEPVNPGINASLETSPSCTSTDSSRDSSPEQELPIDSKPFVWNKTPNAFIPGQKWVNPKENQKSPAKNGVDTPEVRPMKQELQVQY